MRRDVAASVAVLCAAGVLVGVLLAVLGGDDRSSAFDVGSAGAHPGPFERGDSVELEREHEAAARARSLPTPAVKVAAVEQLAALEPGHVRLRGTVVLPDGSPARDAHVALLPRRGREPDGKPLVQGTSDARGTYVLTAEHVSDALLIVLARGCEPQSRELALESQDDRELEPIELAEGATIAGRVSAGDQPVRRCEVVAILDRTGERFPLAGGTLVWLDGRFVWSFTMADTAEDGSYRIGGLARAGYQVRISTMRGGATVLGLVEHTAQAARAPAEGVDFEVGVATLRFRFLGSDGPVSGIQAELRSGQWMKSALSDEKGEVAFRAVPGLECKLIAEAPNLYQRTSMPLLAPAAGLEREEVIVLRPFTPPTQVRFEVLSTTGEEIRYAHFLFYRADSDADVLAFERRASKDATRAGDIARMLGDSPPGGRSKSGSVPDGVFTLKDIPPGKYRVVVQVGERLSSSANWRGARGAYQYCDAQISLDVPATGIVEHSIRVRHRGAFAITARNAAGVQLAASCKLRDARGVHLESLLLVRGQQRWAELSLLDEKDVTRLYTELCGGSCELELACPGYRTQKILVELVPGEVMPVEVVLEAE